MSGSRQRQMPNVTIARKNEEGIEYRPEHKQESRMSLVMKQSPKIVILQPGTRPRQMAQDIDIRPS